MGHHIMPLRISLHSLHEISLEGSRKRRRPWTAQPMYTTMNMMQRAGFRQGVKKDECHYL